MSTDITNVINDLSTRFDPRDSLRNLETVLADPLLKALFRGALSGSVVGYRPRIGDVLPEFRHGQFGYRLNETIANEFWLDLQRIAQIIHCAASNYNPFIATQPLSADIPYAALDEISLSMPAISLTLVYDLNPLFDLLESRERVVERVQILKTIGFYFINWVAEAVRRSVKKGETSLWNWGAFWGMSREEFVARAKKGYSNGGFKELMEEVEFKKDEFDYPLASLIKKDSDALALRLTDGETHEIRIVDPTEPLIVLDCADMMANLALNCDDDVVQGEVSRLGNPEATSSPDAA
jgi:hypothetical protein